MVQYCNNGWEHMENFAVFALNYSQWRTYHNYIYNNIFHTHLYRLCGSRSGSPPPPNYISITSHRLCSYTILWTKRTLILYDQYSPNMKFKSYLGCYHLCTVHVNTCTQFSASSAASYHALDLQNQTWRWGATGYDPALAAACTVPWLSLNLCQVQKWWG